MDHWLNCDVCLIEAENLTEVLRKAGNLVEKSGVSSLVRVFSGASGLMCRYPEAPDLRLFDMEAPLSGESFGRVVHQVAQYCLYEGSKSRRTVVWFEDYSTARGFIRAFTDRFVYRLRERPADRFGAELLCVTMDEAETREVLKSGSLKPANQRSDMSSAKLAASPDNLFGEPADYFSGLPLYMPGSITDEARLYIKRHGILPKEDIKKLQDTFYPKFYMAYRDILKRYAVRYDGTCVVRVEEPILLENLPFLLIVPISLRENISPYVSDAQVDNVLYLDETPEMTVEQWGNACYETCTDYFNGRKQL